MFARRLAAFVDGLALDFRLALRGLRRDWRFSMVAVAMLALALGLNVTVFTVFDTMLFRGLPHAARSDRIAYFQVRSGAIFGRLSYTDFVAYRSQAGSFQGLAFAGAVGAVVFRDATGRPIDTAMTRVSANLFGVLGVQPAMGRDFARGDDSPGAAPVAILSHYFWNSRLNRPADVIGSAVHINDEPVTVVGVMPEGFVNVYEQNVWMPVKAAPGLEGNVVGRLRDEATWAGAQSEIATIHGRLEADAPLPNRILPSVKNYSQAHMAPDAPIIYGSLWAGGWFVLLIASANLANLVLVRTVGRSREFVTRSALGAGGMRLMRPVVLEMLFVAAIAAPLALVITRWSVARWASATASRYLALDYELNWTTIAYAAAASLAVAVLSASAPIVRIAMLGRSGALADSARVVSQGPRARRLGTALVAGQVALSIVLISGAGILIRSLFTIVHAESGVADPRRIFVGALKLPSATFPDHQSRLGYLDRLEAQFDAIPGVAQSAFASSLPVDAGGLRAFEFQGQPASTDVAVRVQFLSVSAGYFHVVGVSAVAGRTFDDRDREDSLPVAIVNRKFADTFLSGEEPLGRSLRGSLSGQALPWRTVVGVVPDIMQGDTLRQEFKPLVYVPMRQDPNPRAVGGGGTGFRGTNFLLRIDVGPSQVSQPVRARVQALDPDVILDDIGTLHDSFVFDRDRMDIEHAELGKHAAAAPVLAAIALLLAAIGLYAVMAHSVGQRTREIGVRLAIGAAARDIRRLVRREGMRPVFLGLTAGLTMALGVNRLLRSQLVGVSPYDPLTMAGGVILLVVVGLLACQLPVRKAARTDPAVALRCD